MKLPGFPKFAGKRKNHPEVFLSLLLYPDAVEAAIWELGRHGMPNVLGAVTQDLVHDSWQERIKAADKCITTLEDIAQTTNLQKVILAFPAPYLTQEGDIIKEIRPSIKKLTHELGLVAIGFVSVYQAIVHQHKKQEGVPPSLILLGFTAGSITVSLYRVGNFVGQVTIPKEGSIAEHLEDAFAQFSSSTVLPSRILLYGTKASVLEAAKRELLKHHWTARSNFIHFPKVEILAGDGAAVAVSYAGAGELTNTIGEEELPLEEEESPTIEAPLEEFPVEEEAIRVDDAEEVEEKVEDELDQEEVEEEELTEEDSIEQDMSEDAANVIPVDPEALGFRSTEVEEDLPKPKRRKFSFSLNFKNLFKKLSFKKKESHSEKKGPLRYLAIIIPIVLLVLGGYFFVDVFLPKATVTIKTIPQTVEQSQDITVSTEATSISGDTIPGKKKEYSTTGEKTIPATGKKTIGDAAKGSVTIINKSTVPRTFKKGTTVSTGGVDFTLDNDVSIASASETLLEVKYANAKASVTAKQIGTKGNLSSGKDFTISGVSSNVAVGRNEEAFSGGTSKDMTVVSRADQDKILKDLTTELTEKAKEGFEAEGQEALIPETIKTTVTEKVFSAEIGEEATDVNGKVTVTITGIGYSTSDITALLRDQVKADVPQGYILSSDLPKVETESPEVKKDGTITLSAKIQAAAIPDLSLETLTREIAGKNSEEAKDFISKFPGIGEVNFSIQSLLSKNRLPKRTQNITILVSSGS